MFKYRHYALTSPSNKCKWCLNTRVPIKTAMSAALYFTHKYIYIQ